MVGMEDQLSLWKMPWGQLFRLRELLDRHGIKEFDLRKDRGSWVLDLKDGRRLKLSPQGGAYRMVLESSGGSHDVGLARLINNHFVLGQQAADNLRQLLSSTAGGTSQPTAGGGPSGGGSGSAGGGLVYAGQLPSVDDVLARLLPSAGGTALVDGGQSGQQPRQPQQPSRSRSWLEELTGLLEKIGPWLVLAMMMRQDRQSQTQPIILG
jgi:hypothetical protein